MRHRLPLEERERYYMEALQDGAVGRGYLSIFGEDWSDETRVYESNKLDEAYRGKLQIG